MTKKLFEVLTPKDDVKEWIRDFLDSNAPHFKGKSKKEKIKMALAAYYDAKRESKKKKKKDKLDENIGALVPIVKNVPKIAKNLPSFASPMKSKSKGWWDYPSMAVNTLGIGALATNMGNETPVIPAKSNVDFDPEKLASVEQRFQAAKAKFLQTPAGKASQRMSAARFKSTPPTSNTTKEPSTINPATDKVITRMVDGVPSQMLASTADEFMRLHNQMKKDVPEYARNIEASAKEYNAQKISNKKPGEHHPGVGDKKPKKKVNDKKPGEQHPGVDYQQESYHWANNEDHEGEMILSQLMSISEKTAALSKKIDEDDQFEGWVQAKITKAEDYINSVYNYLMYRKNDDSGYDERMHDVMKSSMPMIKMNIMKLRKESKE